MSNKKMFNITAEFDLDKKPAWLDDFRLKYDQPYSYHITLKTCAFINQLDLSNLINDLSNIVNKYKSIKVAFTELFINHTSKGECIMIKAKKNIKLMEFQREISRSLSRYGKHISKEYEKFEKPFVPHITIARKLSPKQYELAKKELKNNLYAEAWIKKLVLTITEENTFAEWSNANNKTFFTLKEHITKK